jgi:electron transport complex protein RnfG
MVGILADGTLKNISVLQHAETPGLGSKMSEPAFKDQFNDKRADSFNFKVKKDGGDVDAITAATISSRAFCDAVNRALSTFENNKRGF